MPWVTPSLKDVRLLTRNTVTTSLGTGAMIGNSVLRVISDAMAALAHFTLRYIDWLSNQLLPDKAETEWLDRHGDIWLKNSDGSIGRKDATFASGTATVTGVSGVTLPSGLLASYINVRFQTTQQVILSSVPVEVAVTALDAGLQGNVAAGETLSFTQALTDVDSDLTVVSMTGGVDQETDDALRARVLLRIQNPPMGGDQTDYQQWALAVPGVTRAWSYPNEMGIGTITVRIMADVLRASANGFPDADDLVAARAYLDTVRPVTVKDWFVMSPIAFPYDITITGLTPDTTEVRAQIEAAIRAMETERYFPGCMVYRSWVDEAISSAIGEVSHELIFTTLPMTDPGYLPRLGVVNYV